MQEYLMPSRNYEYILTDAREGLEPHAKDWISIPEGAEALTTDGDGVGLVFWKDGFNLVVGLDEHWGEIYQSFKDFFPMYPRCKVLWQRPTQPETLPFIDDNQQSLNDQYAEIEQVRQQSIDATLAERGSRYGDFESVAGTTRALMRVLSNGDTFGELCAAQHEALHMICSKMARIVNGDPDYKDNWHDIGGYAKLIENNI